MGQKNVGRRMRCHAGQAGGALRQGCAGNRTVMDVEPLEGSNWKGVQQRFQLQSLVGESLVITFSRNHESEIGSVAVTGVVPEDNSIPLNFVPPFASFPAALEVDKRFSVEACLQIAAKVTYEFLELVGKILTFRSDGPPLRVFKRHVRPVGFAKRSSQQFSGNFGTAKVHQLDQAEVQKSRITQGLSFMFGQ